MRYLFILFLCVYQYGFSMEIKGRITDTKGEGLAYATIAVQGSTIGTAANEDGYYSLSVDAGTYVFLFQYIGYEQVVEKINVTNGSITKNVVLAERILETKEVVVKADGEDPAYAIVREAIKKRSYYQNYLKNYQYASYIKGDHRLMKFPKKIMGQDVEKELSINGKKVTKDSIGMIMHLSESMSTVYYKEPNTKEIMTASKVSGESNGFSFHNSEGMNYSFYNNTLRVFGGRELISPIATDAMLFYKYKHLQTFLDKENKMVHIVQVIPRNNYGPVFTGNIYIVDKSWNIYQTDLMARTNALEVDMVDSFRIRQVFYNPENDKWVKFNQLIDFKIKLLGFKFNATFTEVRSKYDFITLKDTKFFNKEVYKVEDNVSEYTTGYWDSIRPIPLLKEEIQNYKVEDSTETAQQNKTTKDTAEKFHILNFLTSGYSWDSDKNTTWKVHSPLNAIHFNTVQGYNLELQLDYKRQFPIWKNDDRTTKKIIKSQELKASFKMNYGFSEKLPRPLIEASYDFKTSDWKKISVSLGKQITQINEQKPIGYIVNDWYSLLARRNYMKLYDKTQIKATYQQELVNGILFKGSIELSRRENVDNTSTYNWNKKAKWNYATNDALSLPCKECLPTNYPNFATHNAAIVELQFRLRYNQTYATLPKSKKVTGWKYPEFYFTYKGGSVDGRGFHQVDVRANRKNIKIWHLGLLDFNASTGIFLKKPTYFLDYKHFNGNSLTVNSSVNYRNGFFLLPFYSYSTTNQYTEIHVEHNFMGLLMNRLPIFKKLNWREVVNCNILLTNGQEPYIEASVGLSNIGFNVVRGLRIDYAMGWQKGKAMRNGIVLGMDIGN